MLRQIREKHAKMEKQCEVVWTGLFWYSAIVEDCLTLEDGDDRLSRNVGN
jgi:hypothetical protein